MTITRYLAAVALACGLAFPASASELTQLTDAERQAFRDEVRAYLLDNPEVLMEAIAVLEKRQEEAQAANDIQLVRDNASALFEDGYSFVGGNPEGDVTIVEFLDYKCGYCKRAFPEVKALVEGDGDIRIIVKEFPILGEQSVLASRFAIAVLQVAGPDAYEAVHDAFMLLRGDVDDAALSQIAAQFDLDETAIRARMDSDEVTAVIQKNRALGQTLSISGTPSFVFGDQMVRGYVPLEAMTQIVAELRGE